MANEDTEIEPVVATLTFALQAPTAQELAQQLADVLQEHMHPEHELHVSYNAMEVAAQTGPGRRHLAGFGPNIVRDVQTTVFFEYSALVVLRHRGY